MKYYSDLTKKVYNTVEECEKAELELNQKLAKQMEEQKAREEKIAQMSKHIEELKAQKHQLCKQIEDVDKQIMEKRIKLADLDKNSYDDQLNSAMADIILSLFQ